jgi:hypothetical protein
VNECVVSSTSCRMSLSCLLVARGVEFWCECCALGRSRLFKPNLAHKGIIVVGASV